MVSKWVITPIYPIYRQVITHLLTIDPNFQQDILVGGECWELRKNIYLEPKMTLKFWGSKKGPCFEGWTIKGHLGSR